LTRDLGTDISGQRPKHVADFLGERIHRVTTVCDAANEECPYFTGAERIHWPFQDPALATSTHEERLQLFRQVRQEITRKMEFWLIVDRKHSDLTPA
jgi:arsenate reductase